MRPVRNPARDGEQLGAVTVAGRTAATDAELTGQTAQWIARLRAAEEGREGLSSFIERRAPSWRKG